MAANLGTGPFVYLPIHIIVVINVFFDFPLCYVFCIPTLTARLEPNLVESAPSLDNIVALSFLVARVVGGLALIVMTSSCPSRS